MEQSLACKEKFSSDRRWNLVRDQSNYGQAGEWGGEKNKRSGKSGWIGGVLFILLIFMAGCTQISGTLLPREKEVLLVGDVVRQEVRFYDLDSFKSMGSLHVKNYRFSGFELLDPNRLFFYGTNEKKILLYDLVKGSVTEEILVDEGVKDIMKVDRNFFRLLLSDGKKVANLSFPEGRVEVIKTLPFTARKFIPSEDHRVLYFLHEGKDLLSKVNMESGKVLFTQEVVANAAAGWENPSTHELWIGGHGTVQEMVTSIARYDAETGRFLGTLTGGIMPIRFYADKEHERVYVISHGSNLVQSYRFSGEKLNEADTGLNPYGIDADKERLYIANYDSNTVDIFSKDTLKEEGEFYVGDDPLLIRYRGKGGTDE